MLRNSYYKLAIAESHRPTLNCFIFQREEQISEWRQQGGRVQPLTTKQVPRGTGPCTGTYVPMPIQNPAAKANILPACYATPLNPPTVACQTTQDSKEIQNENITRRS